MIFETLYSYPRVLRRHREGPLAAERAAFVEALAARGLTRETQLRQCRYCLCVAREVQRRPPDRLFDRSDVSKMADDWAARRVAAGRAATPRWAQEQFRATALNFLRSLGRLESTPSAEGVALGEFDAALDEFVSSRRERYWQSEATCRSGRWQIRRFLADLKQRGVALLDLQPSDIDGFFERASQRWGRRSLCTSATMLRQWLQYAEERGWCRPGMSAAVEAPRVYRNESLPLGPRWDTVARMLAATEGDTPGAVRDRAILLLLSVYGLRSGEVCRLRLDDLDWAENRIRFERSKSRHMESAPLHPAVGEAIVRYLTKHRPATNSRAVFLTLRPPHRPVSGQTLYSLVARRYPPGAAPSKGCGPHGLRHACARHLLEAGHSLKEVGDHLGHRSPDSTRTYAKVALRSLREVAFEDLGGLL